MARGRLAPARPCRATPPTRAAMPRCEPSSNGASGMLSVQPPSVAASEQVRWTGASRQGGDGAARGGEGRAVHASPLWIVGVMSARFNPQRCGSTPSTCLRELAKAAGAGRQEHLATAFDPTRSSASAERQGAQAGRATVQLLAGELAPRCTPPAACLPPAPPPSGPASPVTRRGGLKLRLASSPLQRHAHPGSKALAGPHVGGPLPQVSKQQRGPSGRCPPPTAPSRRQLLLLPSLHPRSPPSACAPPPRPCQARERACRHAAGRPRLRPRGAALPRHDAAVDPGCAPEASRENGVQVAACRPRAPQLRLR